METQQRRLDHTHTGILFLFNVFNAIKKKEWNSAICNNVDVPQGYYAKWNNSKINTVITYMRNLKSKKMNDFNTTETDSWI